MHDAYARRVVWVIFTPFEGGTAWDYKPAIRLTQRPYEGLH